MKKVLGYCIISVPFVCLYLITAQQYGWADAAIGFAFTLAACAGIALCTVIGADLIGRS